MKKPIVIVSLSCDEVIQHTDGKVSLIGIFENINANTFPTEHPRFAIFNRWAKGEGEFELQIRLLDPSRENVIDESVPTRIRFPSQNHCHNDTFFLVNTPFESRGIYWMESLLDGKPVHHEPLNVVQKREALVL